MPSRAMTDPLLDEAVREHYRASSLDADALRTLREGVLAASPEAQTAGAQTAGAQTAGAQTPEPLAPKPRAS